MTVRAALSVPEPMVCSEPRRLATALAKVDVSRASRVAVVMENPFELDVPTTVLPVIHAGETWG